MTRDDIAFRNDIFTAKEALVDAINELGTFDLVSVIGEEETATRVFTHCEEFRYVGAISGGTDIIKHKIRTNVLPLLSDYDRNVTESLATTIRENLTEWYGPSGTLPYVFKSDYLNDLSSCLGAHYEVFLMLADIMESLSAVLAEARHQVLEIMDSTVVALEGTRPNRSSAGIQTAAAIIAGLAIVVGTAGAGTPIAAGTVAAGFLTTAGGVIAIPATQVSGGDPLEVLEDAGSKLLSVQTNLREAVDQIELALDEVINVTSGPHSGDFAGPDLGELLQNFGTHEA